jgi:hypothetical protein
VKLAAGLGAAVVALLVGLLGGVALLVMATAAVGSRPASASATALADIPAELLSVYQEAAEATCHMPWQVLAAVGKVESDHGRSQLAGVLAGANSAGAMGPMQFLAATWAAYGVDGDGDGVTSAYSPTDAIWGAANYLCANGAGDTARLRDAIWNYNHASWYVDQVLAIAAGYAAALPVGDASALVAHPNLSLAPQARQDLLNGVVDQRVVDLLAWAVQRHRIAVSVLRTGHSQYVRGTNRVSNHYLGRGVDIYAVDGQVVSPSAGLARSFAIEAAQLPPPGRADEIGLPWADLAGLPGVFSNGDHQNHLHFGWA